MAFGTWWSEGERVGVRLCEEEKMMAFCDSGFSGFCNDDRVRQWWGFVACEGGGSKDEMVMVVVQGLLCFVVFLLLLLLLFFFFLA